MRSQLRQYTTILKKNYLVYWRKRIYLYDLANIVAIYCIIVALGFSYHTTAIPIPVYVSLAILMHCRNTVLAWVSEKQNRLADIQKIMGVSKLAYNTAWLTYFILNGIAMSLVFSTLLLASRFYTFWGILPGQMVGIYVMYMVASVNLSLFLSTFFWDTNLACQTITFIHIFLSFLYNVINLGIASYANIVTVFASIFPTLSIQYVLASFVFKNQVGRPFPDYSVTQGSITMACQFVFYLIMFLYMEQVMPRPDGCQKHPLFLFKRCKHKQKDNLDLTQSFELQNLSSARFYQPIQEEKKIKLCLKEVTKSYGSKQVVKGITINIFEGQVVCLVGHNGAGKSTTLNMISGLLKPTTGTISFKQRAGSDIVDPQRCQDTGIVLHASALYNCLLVRENIEFYARLKGVNQHYLRNQCTKVMQQCGILQYSQTSIRHLSAGSLRKTCLACAAVGQSGMIILDEPTSRLDPASKREVWDLIRQFRREGRTVIISTQDLQEAEVLADRVAMLTDGELTILGTIGYIKQRFGCGYRLEVSLNPDLPFSAQKTVVRQQVKKIITGAIEDQQCNKMSMKFLLPFSEEDRFSCLFRFLEQEAIKFSIALSSIQDIFIKFTNNPDSVLDNEPLPILPQLTLPQFQASYSFRAQFKAIFVVKLKVTLRDIPSIISEVMLAIYLAAGLVLTFTWYRWPRSSQIAYLLENYYVRYSIGYFMCIVFSFATLYYSSNLVKQHQNQWKHVSTVMGMSKTAYWAATYCFDTMMICISLSVVYSIVATYLPSNPYTPQSFGLLGALFALFATSLLSFTYLASFLFVRSNTAYQFFPYLLFYCYYLIPQIPKALIPMNQYLPWILPLISPFMSLTSGLQSQASYGEQIFQQILKIRQQSPLYVVSYSWYPVWCLFFHTILFSLLAILIGRRKVSESDKQTLKLQQMRGKISIDSINQQNRIAGIEQQAPVIVSGLYKKYDNQTMAIRNSSFLIEKGETFGLLGPNGSGKSSLFKILTAKMARTYGFALLKGKDISSVGHETFMKIGVCPENNSLYDDLTVQEHITYFGQIKGVGGNQKKQIIDFYITHLQLEGQRRKKARELSDGNRRKLSVAMALVGNPTLIFVDQPSSGMDPVAKRYLWNVLHSTNRRKDRSIILTTHCISEADSLCDRIGIIVKGQIHSLATPQELKQRYCNGYTLKITPSSDMSFQETQKQITGVIEAVDFLPHQLHQNETQLQCKIPLKNMRLSSVFDILSSQLRRQSIIQEFTITQTTLEQIFINIISNQQALLNQQEQLHAEEQMIQIRGQLGLRERQVEEKERLLSESSQRIQQLEQQIRNMQTIIGEISNNAADEGQYGQNLFAGGTIFDQEDGQQRAYLIDELNQKVGKIEQTVLLFRLNPYNGNCLLESIRDQEHIVFVVKLDSGLLLGAYQKQCFQVNTSCNDSSLMMSLWKMRSWTSNHKITLSRSSGNLGLGDIEINLRKCTCQIRKDEQPQSSVANEDEILSLLNNEKQASLAQLEVFSLKAHQK